MYQRPESPLVIGGVLDDGFKLVRASFSQVIWLSLAGAVAANFANLFAGGGLDSGLSPVRAVVVGAGILVGALLSVVFYAAILARINAVATGTEMTSKSAMRLGRRFFWPLLGCGLLYGLRQLGPSHQ